MIETLPKRDLDMCEGCIRKDDEKKHVKYLKALKAIEESLINWGYDCEKHEFQSFIDGVLAVTKDWSDEE